MAIGTNSTIEYFGTQDAVHASARSTISNGGYSVAADMEQWTNDDDAPFAYFVLKLFAAGLGGAPSAGATIDLFTRLINVVGSPTPDATEAQADFDHYYLGSFPVENADEDQTIVIGPIRLPNLQTSQVHEFYLKNNTGQATGADYELYVTPATFGPHA